MSKVNLNAIKGSVNGQRKDSKKHVKASGNRVKMTNEQKVINWLKSFDGNPDNLSKKDIEIFKSKYYNKGDKRSQAFIKKCHEEYGITGGDFGRVEEGKLGIFIHNPKKSTNNVNYSTGLEFDVRQ